MAAPQKIRPIYREVWQGDIDAAAIMTINQASKLSAALSDYSRQRFNSASSGQQITPALGGGVYSPIKAPAATTRGTL